ncbi:MAG: hypothetical protein M3Z36_12200, partial [Acidobacteriota bacterium]|nr:hypothetical protein [Acidobacteriota bacterium]
DAALVPASHAVRRPLLAAALILALVSIAFAWNLADPFLSDDYILIANATFSPARIVSMFHVPGGDGAFRPLGYLYFAVVKLWAHAEPSKWHILGLLLHLLNCFLVFRLAFSLWKNCAAALLAAMVFGLHGTRPEVVTWTAGSFDLLATFFVLSSAAVFFPPTERYRMVREAISLLLMLFGIWSKESAYVFPVLMFGLALASGRLSRRVIGFIGVAFLECGILFAYRWSLFHGPGGYVDPATGRPQILSLHAIPTLKALLIRIWAILLFPIDWDMATGPVLAAAVLSGCAVLLYLAASSRFPSSRARIALLATTLACVFPAVHLALIGQSGIGSRILYLPSVPFCMLIGLLAGMQRRLVWATLALSLMGVLGHNLSAWHSTAVLAGRACRSASEASAPDYTVEEPPRTVNGVPFFANGYQECVAMHRNGPDR